MIELKNVTKIYHSSRNDVRAIDNMSIKLPSRGLVAIYGENGCGKTTLLNLLGTIDTDYTGEILFDGKDYRGMIPDLRRNIISFVFQENQFVDYLDVGENIALFAEDTGRIEEACKEFGIEDKMFSLSDELSGGQKQRAAVVRGLAKQYAVLLVDEPTSSMNEQMEKTVFEKLSVIAENKLVLLVSHNITLIRKYAGLIVHMDKGTIESFETNSRDSIIYENDTILVPEDDYSLEKIDTGFIKDNLDRKNTVHIKAVPGTGEKPKIDYNTVTEVEKLPQRKLPAGLRKSITYFSMYSMKWGIIVAVLLTVICVTALNLAVWLTFYNKYETELSCFKNNTGGEVHYRKDVSTVGDRRPEMKYSDLEAMEREFGSSVTVILKNMEALYLDSDPDSPLNCLFKGIALYNENEVTLRKGRCPETGELLITDYIADILTSKMENVYASEEDILEKGIQSEIRTFKVSGIIATDYKELINRPDKREFNLKKDKDYSFFYYPLDGFLNDDSIPYFCDIQFKTAGEVRAIEKCDVSPDINENFDEIYSLLGHLYPGRVYVNKFIADITGSELLYLQGTQVIVAGEVDSEEMYPVYYADKEAMARIKQEILDSAPEFAVYPKKAEELKYLDGFKVEHDTYVSSALNDIDYNVFVIRNIIGFVAIFIMVIVLFITLILLCRIIEKDNKLVAFVKMSGYSDYSILGIELRKLFVIGAAVTAVSAVLTLLFGILINKAAGIAYGIKVNMFNGNIAPILLSYAGLFLVYLAVCYFIYRRTNRKKIIDLLK
jgi:ABC-type lipoprotein export system ATPase subunit